MKFGRVRPANPPVHRLAKYINTAALPPIPASFDGTTAGAGALHDVLGNDQLGDCVCAAGGHVIEALTATAGNPYVQTLAQTISDYEKIGGYNSNDPSTDQGCDEQTAFGVWSSTGFSDGSRILAWTGLDATHADSTKTAIFLFGNAFLGLELPDAYVNPFPSGDGFVWDVAGDPVPQNGHAICALGYNEQGLIVDTWGMIGTLTWAAYAKYCVTAAGGEAYTLVTADLVAKGRNVAPNGIAWLDLLLDFHALGGAL